MTLLIGNSLELARTIMRGIALALGGPKDLFEGERAGDPFWILRVIGYPPISNLSCLSNPNGEEVGWYSTYSCNFSFKVPVKVVLYALLIIHPFIVIASIYSPAALEGSELSHLLKLFSLSL